LLALRRGASTASALPGQRNIHGGFGGRPAKSSGGAAAGLAIATGLVIGAKAYADNRQMLKAESRKSATLKAETKVKAETKYEPDLQHIMTHENRVRMFSPKDKIFNYFASVQHVADKGKRAMMMTPLDFYASITPDCTLHNGVGSGVYVDVTEAEMAAGEYAWGRSSVDNSLLNRIGELGLISYTDYCFLLSLLSTPKKYIETAFNVYDVTGSGNITIKEFAYVSTKMADKEGGFGTYSHIDQEKKINAPSGLLKYLFGKDGQKTVTKEDFCKLQDELLEEIIELEFMEYDRDNSGRISERDLGHFMLKSSKVPPKKKVQLLNGVEKMWPSKGRGISYPSFRNLFLVLAAGGELERALFLLDVENIGVDLEEFRKVSSWVSQQDLSDHVANVIFALLGENGRLYKTDQGPILFDWRSSRSYDKGTIQINLGQHCTSVL